MKQLTVEDLVVGNKYVPHDKTTEGYDGLEYSAAWRIANEKGQGYLYYVGKDEDGYLFWWEFDGDSSGDYFLPSDVTPYTEPGVATGNPKSNGIDPKDFIPFNLEEALKAPERVVYRNGQKPLEWYHLKNSQEIGRKIISVTPLGNTRTHNIDGCWGIDESEDDLMLLPLPKTTYWINVMEEGSYFKNMYVTGPWRSEAEAFQQIAMPDKCIKTITFEI